MQSKLISTQNFDLFYLIWENTLSSNAICYLFLEEIWHENYQ